MVVCLILVCQEEMQELHDVGIKPHTHSTGGWMGPQCVTLTCQITVCILSADDSLSTLVSFNTNNNLFVTLTEQLFL